MFVSKKRKRCSSSSLSHPLLGISTRSKSQFHLHRNRSGRARPDPTGPMNRGFEIRSSKTLCKRPKSGNPNPETLNDNDGFLNTLTKDLRARRVFSSKAEPSKNATDDQEFGMELGCDEAEDDVKTSKRGRTDRFGNGFSFNVRDIDEEKGTESEITEKINLGYSSETQFLNYSDPRLALLGKVNGLCALEQSGDDDGNGNPKGIDNSGKKCSQKMPEKPDDSEVNENNGNTKESVTEKPSTGNAQDGVQKIFAGSKNNFLLRPFRKIFKAPGSVSYGRLLPYLMVMEENNSCALKIDKHPSLYNGLIEKKLQDGLASQCEEASMERTECLTIHSDTETKMVVDSFNESSSGEELILTSPKNITESPTEMLVDNYRSKPPVNEQNEILDLKFSCKEQKLTNLDSCVSVIVEDSQIVEDNINRVNTDDTKPVKNKNKDADNGFSCEDQNGELPSISSSSIMDDGHLHKDNELVQYSEDSMPSLFDGKKNFDIEYCREIQNFNQLEQRSGDKGEVLHQIDGPNEESIQMTPPDAEIFDKRDIEENGVDRGDCVLQKRDDGLGKPLDGIHRRNATLADSKQCKMVLNPLSRLKILKIPGSFNYRRLLPFLTNIAQDNPYVSVNGHCLKPEKVLEQKLVSPKFVPNDWEIPSDKSIDSGLHTENQTYDSGTLPTAQLTSANDSSNDKDSVSPENSSEFQMSFDSGKEQLPDKASELETCTYISSSVQEPGLSVPSLHSINCEASSREECVISVSDHLCAYTDGESSRSVMESSDDVKEAKVDRFYQNSSSHETPVSSGLPAVGLRKGILKRNPRGCRGLCTCLNCVSFRLHAERAFEFSRNQMQDANEVALDLIKELSHLRAIYEKSVAGVNDQLSVHVSPPLAEHEVKEACNKASEAEEQARIRLTQMNYDLDMHCRITCLERPRVRFANCVEEKCQSKSKFSKQLEVFEA